MVIVIGALLLLLLIASTLLTVVSSCAHMPINSTYVIDTINFMTFFGMATLLFAIMYKLLPDIKIIWKDVWTGAAITTLLLAQGLPSPGVSGIFS